MKLKLLAIVVLLAGGALAVAASLGTFGASATAASTFLTAQAAVADVVNQVAATGTVAPTTTYSLAFGAAPSTATASSASSSSSSAQGSTTVTWPVKSVTVKVGDSVKKGQVLATASTTDLQAQVDDASRAVGTANLQLEQAQTQLDNATTTDTIRQARIGLYNAESGVAHARTTLTALQVQLKLATLTAPVAGIVTAVSIQVGVDAPSGVAITLAGGTLEVTTSVVESDVASISVGQAATVAIAALNGASIDGTVASIAPAASSGSSGSSSVVSFAVEVALTNPPAGLRSGMTADVTITTASATGVLAIPARALTGTAGAYRVRVLAADGSVSTKVVTVGLITSSLVEVKSGLQAGDRVVTGTSTTQSTTNGAAGGGGGGGNGAFPGGGGIRVVNP
jgi:macrolide-specific efflux system membrane fusion protein